MLTTTIIRTALDKIIAAYEQRYRTRLKFTIPQRQHLDDISAWIARESSTLDIHKGLYICGGHGSGKTLLATFIQTIFTQGQSFGYTQLRPYSWISYDDIYSAIRYTASDEILKRITTSQIIDDYVYQGRSLAKVYGNDDYVADLVISKIDRKITGTVHRAIITSNYTPSYLLDNTIIHPGTYSRIGGLFNILAWTGQDHRLIIN